MAEARTKSRGGFTLIELSIVLVIIGLIVGGVLVGRDLIGGARVRAQVSQLEKLKTGYSLFVQKYNAIPGDFCRNVTRFGLLCGNSSPYYDNNIIDDQNGAQIDGTGLAEQLNEPMAFFSQLILANLYERKMTCDVNWYGMPFGYFYTEINPTRSGMLAGTHNGQTWLFMGINNLWADCSTNWIAGYSNGGIMTPAQAQALDEKLDDGRPGTGDFYMTRPGAIRALVDNRPAQCVTTAAATAYNMPASTNECIALYNLE